MDGWINNWRQKHSRGRRRPWPWLLVAVLLLFTGTGWGVMSYTWKKVTLEVDGQRIATRTFASTVGEFLSQQHITLGAEDAVTPALDAPVTRDIVITIKRAVPVKISADGREKEILTPPDTVANVLNKAGVTLNAADRVIPDLNATIAAGDTIKVIRVTVKTETVSKEINYRVERRPEPQLEKGITRLLQEGVKGLQEETYRVILEDGQEVKRELVSTKTLKEPVPEIVAVGAMDTASRGGQSFRFERVFWATATAYTHSGAPTATGAYPRVGTIAVDPAVVPLGTRLYVEGYGYGIAQDIGSAIKGDRIDVFLDTEADTRRWGVRRVKVYVLR
ncbi:3D domain-containing protein [Neomoorella thermoacetica]|uniref:3D domain-containing protein n=1 Tax=Neomoorella thermoacetica TaxID=1525 RepID=UPI0009083CD3|nr:3D domain-containing protein [Moorella thermoacetica]APC07245.1 cell wall-binding protein YocH precursor [Moorella thermoacetica]